MNCRKCGAPLTKGNIKVVRKKGKRTFRIHRHCPEPTGREITLHDVEGNPTIVSREFVAGAAGSPLQRPQEGTGGPVTVEAVLDYPTPPKYRYFITRATAERLQRAVEGRKVGISLEVFFVPDYQVEANPEALAGYVEIEFSWPTD